MKRSSIYHVFTCGTKKRVYRTIEIKMEGNTVFTQISAAALIKFFARQVRRLIEGGPYLKIGQYKEIFFFNLTVNFPSV